MEFDTAIVALIINLAGQLTILGEPLTWNCILEAATHHPYPGKDETAETDDCARIHSEGFLDTSNYRSRVLKPLAESLEIPKLNFQVIRRTIATRAQNLGLCADSTRSRLSAPGKGVCSTDQIRLRPPFFKSLSLNTLKFCTRSLPAIGFLVG